jgi:hypothetical protein
VERVRLLVVGASIVAATVVLIVAVSALTHTPAPTIHVSADMVFIDTEQVALDRRSDTNRTNLTSNEQKVVAIVLAHPAITNILTQKGELYIHRIVQDNVQSDCESDCSEIMIGWNRPESASLFALVGNQQSDVIQWLFDP